MTTNKRDELVDLRKRVETLEKTLQQKEKERLDKEVWEAIMRLARHGR